MSSYHENVSCLLIFHGGGGDGVGVEEQEEEGEEERGESKKKSINIFTFQHSTKTFNDKIPKKKKMTLHFCVKFKFLKTICFT